MTKPNVLPTARDLMVRDVITLRPETELIDAIHVLLRQRVSGAPVVDSSGAVVGILTEHDCLRVFASDEYSAEDYGEAGSISTVFTASVQTVSPDLDIYGIAQLFVEHRIRRMPVVDDGRLLGMVSRQDVLGAIDRMREVRLRPPRTASPPGLYLSATDSPPDAIAERLE